MKTIMAAKNSQDSSSSKKHFHWSNKVSNEDEVVALSTQSSLNPSSNSSIQQEKKNNHKSPTKLSSVLMRKKLQQAVAVSKLRSVFALAKNRAQQHFPNGLFGPKVIGTLFGYRNGHVHIAFQKDATSQPSFLIELSTPISGLVREMASGLVRIVLECDKEEEEKSKKTLIRLVEEPIWRTFCNGKKCGFANRKGCGEKEWKILKAVEPISMGAGVLPAAADDKVGEGGDQSDGEIMYMRAKFERVVGSRDSEAFYMMNPDSNGAPELSVYLLRV